MTNVSIGPMPPEKAIKWFKSKGYALGFDWRDVWKEEHAIAFTVAKAASIDLLQDIRGELEKALVSGETFESFQKNLKPKLVARGWWGRGGPGVSSYGGGTSSGESGGAIIKYKRKK